MTAEQIRDAEQVLRVTYLPILRANVGEDWRTRADVSELLADLLARMADGVETLELSGFDPAELEMPEYQALAALVEKINGAHQ